MNENYYLALFNEETWTEFLNEDSLVYGTTINKQGRIEKLKPGDYLICYVSLISRFVGLLEVTSESFLDDHRIWKNDIYPVRVNVRPIYILKAESGIPLSDLKKELIMFKKYKSPNSWKFFFINSLNKFQEHDAKLIIVKLKAVSEE